MKWTKHKQKEKDPVYSIVSVYNEDSLNSGKNTMVRVQVKGHHSTFIKTAKFLYENWLDGFSTEDAAYLGVIVAAQHSGGLRLVRHFPRKRFQITPPFLVVSMFFFAFMFISNTVAFKLLDVNLSGIPLLGFLLPNFQADAGILFFPILYICSDILTEVYGFKLTRLVIWVGFLGLFLSAISFQIAMAIPPSHLWSFQNEFTLVLGPSLRFFVSGLIAYLCGEFLNSAILSQMKIMTMGRFLALRSLASTIVGSLVDTLIFCYIAFYGNLDNSIILKMAIYGWGLKLIWGVVGLPIIYASTRFLKKLDGVDAYDFKCSLNPFSLKT